MQLGQVLRRATNGLGRFLGWAGRGINLGWRTYGLKGAVRLGIAVLALLFGYYIIGAIILYKIDADLDYQLAENEVAPGQSRTVAIVADIIDREIKHGWTPNDPFYKPTVIFDNMQNFQRGILQAFGRFGIAMTDQLGRSRGSSQADADLERASGQLRYPPDRWVWNPSENAVAVTITSEDAYRRAAQSLRSYNERLAAGNATFERRADNLRETLNLIANDLGSTSAMIDDFIYREAGFPINWTADDIFYRNKGQLYGYYMILRELRIDMADVIEERRLTTIYDGMLQSFQRAIGVQPWLIMNSRPDAQVLPNHLSAQGFYLLRARTEVREVTSVLEQ